MCRTKKCSGAAVCPPLIYEKYYGNGKAVTCPSLISWKRKYVANFVCYLYFQPYKSSTRLNSHLRSHGRRIRNAISNKETTVICEYSAITIEVCMWSLYQRRCRSAITRWNWVHIYDINIVSTSIYITLRSAISARTTSSSIHTQKTASSHMMKSCLP